MLCKVKVNQSRYVLKYRLYGSCGQILFIHFFLLSFSFLAGTGTVTGSGFSSSITSTLPFEEFYIDLGLHFRES